jgi:gliding motility-associated-like protein
VTVTVTPKPATPTPLLQPDTDYCIGSTLVGFVQGTGGTINWNVQAFGGAININQVGEAFNLNTANLPVPPGTYPVVITQIQNGCVSDPLSYNVELHGAPVLNPFAATTPICEGGAINITGLAGNFDYLWTTPSGATFTTQDLAISNVNVNDHQGFYTYILIDKNFGCRSEIQSVYQEVNATPTGIVIQTNSPLCAGTTLSLNTPLIGNATYAWTGPSNFTSSTRNNTIPAVLANGTYDVVVTVEGCASVPASADVVVIAAPNANAGADATIQYGAVATLLATGGFVYNWSPAMLLNNSSTQSPTTISTLPVGSTSYTVTVADANGCTATDAVTIIVSAEPVANSIMNLITPNGDGMNDEWHVPFLENLDGYQLSIYARAGNLVYSSTNYDQKWAGTMDGAALPDGPYWFVIALKEGRVIKGAITVKR